MRRRVRLQSLAVLAGVLLTSASSAAPVPAGPYRVLQLNVCGNARNPECGVEGSTGAPVDALVDLVVGLRPDVVALQEVCGSQVDALAERASARGWPMRAVFVPVWSGPDLRCRDEVQGDALLSARPLTDVAVRCLARCDRPVSVVERRNVVCGTTVLHVATRVCVTHVGRRSLQAEVAGVVAFLAPDVRRMPVVLAGDLNTAPFAQVLDPLYASGAPGSRGRFDEADACATRRTMTASCNVGTLDAPGANVKLDYVFATRGDFARLRARTIRMAWSDHDALLAVLEGCPTRSCRPAHP